MPLKKPRPSCCCGLLELNAIVSCGISGQSIVLIIIVMFKVSGALYANASISHPIKTKQRNSMRIDILVVEQ